MAVNDVEINDGDAKEKKEFEENSLQENTAYIGKTLASIMDTQMKVTGLASTTLQLQESYKDIFAPIAAQQAKLAESISPLLKNSLAMDSIMRASSITSELFSSKISEVAVSLVDTSAMKELSEALQGITMSSYRQTVSSVISPISESMANKIGESLRNMVGAYSINIPDCTSPFQDLIQSIRVPLIDSFEGLLSGFKIPNFGNKFKFILNYSRR